MHQSQTARPDKDDPLPILEIDDLVVEFPVGKKRVRAVDHVSLSLKPGETHCLVGESGSGKSVTARSILQIIDPPGYIASGDIFFRPDHDGESSAINLTRLKPRSAALKNIRGAAISMIFQEPMTSLSPVHRVGDQISEVLRLHQGLSRKDARERTIELLKQVEIKDAAWAVDQYPFEFSGGMRQRVMIAMALSCNPSILIADEPTTALDVTIQASILKLIRDLQLSRNMSVLFITHDMGVVANIADRISVMRHGRLLESGAVTDVLHHPKDPYTIELINAARDLDRPSPIRVGMRAAKPPEQPILTVEHLSKEFVLRKRLFRRRPDTSVGVKDVSIRLKKGENLGVVGESGSGKTTLARCIQRVYELTSGEVFYQRDDHTSLALGPLDDSALLPVWRDIRTIFQDPHSSLNPRMTVGQIIAEPLVNDPTGLRGQALHQRIAELLDLVELPRSSVRRYPHAFSGGQRQRIAIARAIGPNPRVILADEPTSALDVSLRTTVLNLLLELQRKLDLSYIFVSHDIAVVRYFCDRVVVMKDGEVVETGETESVCSNPQEPYTKLLLSSVLRI
ncbi:ABC transporter ATP-binding protein [Bauldia sp.]|uniref:ABC transporter ATP-binding protein n=1 Tax=Bauldia sp. TaxID=2575872 RepID=UPI003BAB0746